MRLLRGRVRPWLVLALALGIVGFTVLDGTAAGVVLAAAAVALFVGVMRFLRDADLSGVTHGGQGAGRASGESHGPLWRRVGLRIGFRVEADSIARAGLCRLLHLAQRSSGRDHGRRATAERAAGLDRAGWKRESGSPRGGGCHEQSVARGGRAGGDRGRARGGPGRGGGRGLPLRAHAFGAGRWRALGKGFVENIHADGPQVYAHEVYVLNHALPNTAYEVHLLAYPFDPACEGTAAGFGFTTLTTNGAGNGRAKRLIRPADVPGELRDATHGIRWEVRSGGVTVYATDCTAVTLD